MDACKEYFNWVDAHPWYKVEQLKKPYFDEQTKKWVTLAKIPTARPYTIQGLCIYLDCNSHWFKQFEISIKDKLKEVKDDDQSEETKQLKDFSTILSHVREIIYHQKLEGAAVGAFNASIIQRDLGLREVQDVKLSNPDGEVFRTSNAHEVVFKKFGEKKEDDKV